MAFAGIITALPREAFSLTQQKMVIGQAISLNNKSILKVSGMGPECAYNAAQDLIQQGAEILISWGCAGGLGSHTYPGQLFLPERIIDQNQQQFLTDEFWRNALKDRLQSLIQCHSGTVLQAGQIVTSVIKKQQLFAEHQAAIVDMESAAIARAAQQAKLAFIVVRSVVDSSDFSFPEWLVSCLKPTGKLLPMSLALKLSRNPFRLKYLLKLSRDFSLAHKALIAAAEIFSSGEFDFS